MTFELPSGCFNFGESFIERNTKGDTTLTLVNYDGTEQTIRSVKDKSKLNRKHKKKEQYRQKRKLKSNPNL